MVLIVGGAAVLIFYPWRPRPVEPPTERTSKEGGATPSLVTPSPTTSAFEEDLRVLFRDFADPAFDDAWKLLDSICLSLGNVFWDDYQARAAANSVGELLRVYVLGGTQRNEMRDAFDREPHDFGKLQELFATLYDKYLRIAVWIPTAAHIAGVSLADSGDYQSWTVQDRRLRQRVQQTVARSAFGLLATNRQRWEMMWSWTEFQPATTPQ